MNLFEEAIAFVRSVGHRVEEHYLINEFVNYVGKETSIVENFLKSKQMKDDDQARAVLSNFVAEIAPVNLPPVLVDPPPVLVDPPPVLVDPPPVLKIPASVTVNVEESASATVTVTTPINPEQNVAS